MRGPGLGAALVIAPAALAAGSMGVLFSGTLFAAALLKGSDQVVRYSIDRAAVDMLYRPLPPQDIFEGKMVIDALVSRFADAAGALVALAGVVVLHLSFRLLSVVSVAAIMTWFASAAIAGRSYRATLLERVRQQSRLSGMGSYVAKMPIVRNMRRSRADQRGLLHPDPMTRLDILRTLTSARARSARPSCSETLLTTALATEIVGFAMLVETPCESAAASTEHRQACRDSIERISRLLFLLSPDEYPGCLVDALGSGGTAFEAEALEYLDTALTSPHREILVPLLERWALATA